MKPKNSKFISFLANYWPLLGYLLISIVFLFPILGQSGVPLKYDWSWPLFDMKEFWNHLFDASSLGLLATPGKYAILVLGLPGTVNLSPSISIKLFLLAIHIIAGYGFYLFLYRRTQSKLISFVTGLAYAFSPYIFIRTIIGFTNSLIAYAVLPLFFLIYFQPKKKFWQYLLCALFLSLIFSQSQAGVLTMLFLIINLIFSANKESLKNFFLTISSMAILVLPWYIVSLFLGSSGALPTGSEVVTLKFIADLPHSLRNTLMLSDHHVTSNFFYSFARFPLIMIGFALTYLIAAFSLFNRKNRSLVLSLIISSILILPFSIGPRGKFTGFYTFVFNHFPQIALFRETYHLEFLLSFALISLFAFGVAQIFRWFPLGRPGSIIVRSVVLLPVLIIIAPYFTFDYAGYFHLQQIPVEYRDTRNFLAENKNFCKKAYYPLNLGFVYFKNDTGRDAINSDSIVSAIGIPYLTDGSSVLNTSSEEMFFRNRLTSQFLEKNDNGEVAALMNREGVNCLIVRTDMDSKYAKVSGLWLELDPGISEKWNNKDLLGLAKNKKGLELKKQFGDKIYIFKVVTTQIFDAEETQTGQIPNGIELSITNWANEFDKYQDGWSRGRYAFWRKELFADLEQDFIYTNKSGAMLSGQINQSGQYNLAVRYLSGGTPGNFEIKIGDTKYKIQKDAGDEKFIVKDLGVINVKKGDKIEITNVSGENAIADIVLTK